MEEVIIRFRIAARIVLAVVEKIFELGLDIASRVRVTIKKWTRQHRQL